MNIKLVAVDMDGTLLNSKKEMPEEFIPWVKSHPEIKTVIAVFQHGIRFMQTIPRTHSTLGIVHKGNQQHTTETLGKFHTENITFSFANSMYKVACVCDLVLSMWQL